MRFSVVFLVLSLAAAGCGAKIEEANERAPAKPDDGLSAVAAAPRDATGEDAEHARVSASSPDDPSVDLISETASASQAHPGKESYARCAACHLPDGAGVPGAFPPLADNVVALGSTAEGREYLVKVVKSGLIGTIDVSGQLFGGAMPAQSPALNDAQIADMLNYLIEELNGRKDDAGFQRFTPDEVAAAFSKHAGASSTETLALRKAAIEATRE